METMPFSDYIDRVSLLCYIFNGCDALFLNAQFNQIIPFLIAHCPMPILTDSSPLAPGVNRFARDGLILKGCSLSQSRGKNKTFERKISELHPYPHSNFSVLTALTGLLDTF